MAEACLEARRLSALVIAAIVLATAACAPSPSGDDPSAIDVGLAPEQIAIAAADATDPRRISDGGWEFVVTPLAHYVVRGVVVARENYSWGWNGRLAPCDVAMVWGALAEDDAWRRLDWSQDGRWYFWHWSGEQPFPTATVIRNSSNTHIVPASSNLKRAARSLGRGDIAELSGELVRIEGRRGAERVTWRSSLSREDVGDGSCELLYLRRLRVNGKVYE